MPLKEQSTSRTHFIEARATLLYIAAMAAVGVAIGFLVALSRSPVVAIVIPLLFSLIAGASGVYVTREDLSQTAGRQRLGFLGVCIVALSGASIASASLVLWMQRSELGPDLGSIVGAQELSPEEQIGLLETRLTSALLGASPEERAVILSRAAERVIVPPDTQEEVAVKLARISPAVRSAVAALPTDALATAPEAIQEELAALRPLLVATETLIEDWIAAAQSGSLNREIAKQHLYTLRNSLAELVGSPNTTPTTNLIALAERPDLIAAMLRLRATIEATDIRTQEATSGTFKRMSLSELNTPSSSRLELIRILAGLAPAERSRLVDQINTIAGGLNYPERSLLGPAT